MDNKGSMFSGAFHPRWCYLLYPFLLFSCLGEKGQEGLDRFRALAPRSPARLARSNDPHPVQCNGIVDSLSANPPFFSPLFFLPHTLRGVGKLVVWRGSGFYDSSLPFCFSLSLSYHQKYLTYRVVKSWGIGLYWMLMNMCVCVCV